MDMHDMPLCKHSIYQHVLQCTNMHAQCIIQAQHANMHAQHANMLALFPGLPCFCSLVCVQYNIQKRKSVKLSSASMYYT